MYIETVRDVLFNVLSLLSPERKAQGDLFWSIFLSVHFFLKNIHNFVENSNVIYDFVYLVPISLDDSHLFNISLTSIT